MKKIFFVLSCLLSFAVYAVEIVCSTPAVAAMTKAVTGELKNYRISVLLPNLQGCAHDYSMTPKEMKLLATADVIVKNGLGFEPFIDHAAQNFKKSKMVDASLNVNEIIHNGHHDGHEAEKHEHHHSRHGKHHHEHGSANSHIFASPVMAERMVRSIAAQLSVLYPSDAKNFRASSEKYCSELSSVISGFSTLPKVKAVIQHSIFEYFLRDAGFVKICSVQDDDAQEPSPAELIAAIKLIKKEKAQVIFAEKGKNAGAVQIIAKETRLPVIELEMTPRSSAPEDLLKLYSFNLSKLKTFSDGIKK